MKEMVWLRPVCGWCVKSACLTPFLPPRPPLLPSALRRETLPSLSRAGVTPALLTLRLMRGKHCRPDQSYAPIQAALQQMARAFSVPLAILPDDQARRG